MGFVSWIGRFFGKEEEVNMPCTVAKERLRLVLVHDRLDVSENVMQDLRNDLIATIEKYMEIDHEALDVDLSRDDSGVALIANIPVLNVRRQNTAPLTEEEPEEVQLPKKKNLNPAVSGAMKPAKVAPAKKVRHISKEKPAATEAVEATAAETTAEAATETVADTATPVEETALPQDAE